MWSKFCILKTYIRLFCVYRSGRCKSHLGSHLGMATERPFLWGLEENTCTDDLPAPHLQTLDVLPHLEAANHEAPASHHPDRRGNLFHPSTPLKGPYLIICPPKIKPRTPHPYTPPPLAYQARLAPNPLSPGHGTSPGNRRSR